MSTTNTTGLNMVTDLLNTFMGEGFSTKSAAEDKDDDKDEGKGNPFAKKGDGDNDEDDKKCSKCDKKPCECKKDKDDKKEDKDEKKEAAQAPVLDLLSQIGSLPTELQKVAAGAAETRRKLEEKRAALAAKQTGEPTTEKSASEKYASGEMNAEGLFNEFFYDELAKIASSDEGANTLLAEKFAQIQAATQPTTAPAAGV